MDQSKAFEKTAARDRCRGYYMYDDRHMASPTRGTTGRGLGKRLAAQRKAKQLSGQELAGRARLSVDTVRSIESGRISNPGILTVARLARVLEASLDDLAGLTRRTRQ